MSGEMTCPQPGLEETMSLLKSTDRKRRLVACVRLGALGRKEAVPALMEALDDGNESVRRAAADALGTLKAREAVPRLVSMLGDPNSRTRSYAAFALGTIGDQRAVRPLIRALARATDDHERLSICRALGKLGSSEAVGPLLELLRHPDWIARWDAAQALVQLKEPRAKEALERLREDPAVPEDLRRRIPSMLRKLERRDRNGKQR